MRRFEALDALRGVAAFAVVLVHQRKYGLAMDAVPHGYLAVDFFFILSGFVMAFSYRDRLRSNMSWGSFLVKRTIRIYPLAVLGAVLGVLILLLRWRLRTQEATDLPSIALSAILNVLLLPDLVSGPGLYRTLFPGNYALWSLFFEFAINLAWAWVGVRAATHVLAAFAVVSGAALIALAIPQGSLDMGANVQTVLGGTARVCFGFTIGLLIYRAHLAIRLPDAPWIPILLGAVLIAAFAAPISVAPGSVPWWDIGCAMVVFPAVVMIGIGQGRGGHFGDFLGRLSYPVYAIHFPILAVAAMIRHTVAVGVDAGLYWALSLGAVVGAAWISLVFYDEPFRRYLNGRGHGSDRRFGFGLLAPGASRAAAARDSSGKRPARPSPPEGVAEVRADNRATPD